MGKNIKNAKTTFLFCDGGSCRKAQSETAIREARAHLRNEGLWDTTHSIKTRCNGRCEDAPTCIVQPGNYWYKELTPQKAIEIIDSHTKEEKPVTPYLLYQENWKNINSDKEKSLAARIFKPKYDPIYGDILVCRAPNSDQYLYPLFKKLFKKPYNIEVKLPDYTVSTITAPHQVIYTEEFDMEIQGSQINFKMTIGSIAHIPQKDLSKEIIYHKVSVAEVLWNKTNPDQKSHIRFKNKMGQELLIISINNNTPIWEYILEIYLNMNIQQPNIVTLNEQQKEN